MASIKLKLKSAEFKGDSTSHSVSGRSTKQKKKKKFMGAGLKIIDPDAICNVNADDKDENPFDPGELNEPDELPQIVDIVDERPKELRLLEEFRQNTKWKTVTEEVPLESFKSRKSKTHQTREGDPNLSSRSRDTGKPRQSRSNDASSSRRKGSDSDLSPPRKKTGRGSDSDQSPPRRKRKGGSDSDLSPPRRKRRGGSDSDLSPPRRKRKGGSDSDLSPPRRTGSSKAHKSPMYRGRGGGSDSDISPPRRKNSVSSSSHFKSNTSSRRDRHGSPNSYARSKQERRRDLSPHRNNEKDSSRSHESGGQKSSKRRNDSDSDLSPPRQRSGSGLIDLHAERQSRSRSEKDDPVRAKTLDGKKAGLQTADALKGELEELRLRELQRFNEMDATVSGRFAQTIVRDRATGKERDAEWEREQQKEEQKKLDERKQQYLKWGKGLKQVQEQEERVNSAIHEMSKPLARYKDDEDLDEHLKNIEREGDPMLKYLSSKKGKSGGKGPSKPRYEGPAPQPNRFSIWPGYRWDGVDRSNGYEKDWFAKVNSRKALQDESYKWSVEDL